MLGPPTSQVNRLPLAAGRRPGESLRCRNHPQNKFCAGHCTAAFEGCSGTPLASTAMSGASPTPGGTEGTDATAELVEDVSAGGAGSATMAPIDDVTPGDQRRAGEALRASFARLAPQGSDEWNFMGAFTLLGDRFGPYQPGASDLGGGANDPRAGSGRRGAGRLGRFRAGAPASTSTTATGPETEKSDFDEAMGHIIEAFRFLHARVSTLEARIANEDVPLEGAAWLAPARELGTWIDPVAAFVRAHAPGGRRGRPCRLRRRGARARPQPGRHARPRCRASGCGGPARPRTRRRRDHQ